MTSKKKVHFEISERKILLRFIDVFVVLAALFVLGNNTEYEYFQITSDNFYWLFVLAFYLSFFASVFELYDLQTASKQFDSIRSIIFTSTGTFFAYLVTPYLTLSLPSNRIQLLYLIATIVIPLLIWRLIYIHFFASHRFLKKVVLVCDAEQLHELIFTLEKVDPNYKIVGFVSTNEVLRNDKYKISNIPIQKLNSYIKSGHISEIVIATQTPELITTEIYNNLIKLLEKGVPIREFSQVYEEMTYRIPVHYVNKDFYRYFPFSRSNQNKLYQSTVRVFEILFSMAGIIIGIIFIPFVVMGNTIGNRGPLFYKQERIGLNGKSFEIFKFRSMVTNAEEGSGAVFAAKNDSRVTPFGKFLRKTRIDEFPQFINILKGDMAVIGPRPERPFFVKEISQIMPFYETRHVVKPGLTGWAQVNYSYGESIDESLIKLQYDLFYIKHRSLFLDINIMIKTISTVLFYRGH